MPSVQVSVDAEADNGRLDGSEAAFPVHCSNNLSTSISINDIGAASAGCSVHCFMAFRDVAIPRFATITNARLIVDFDSSVNINGARGTILAQDALPISVPTAPPATDITGC